MISISSIKRVMSRGRAGSRSSMSMSMRSMQSSFDNNNDHHHHRDNSSRRRRGTAVQSTTSTTTESRQHQNNRETTTTTTTPRGTTTTKKSLCLAANRTKTKTPRNNNRPPRRSASTSIKQQQQQRQSRQPLADQTHEEDDPQPRVGITTTSESCTTITKASMTGMILTITHNNDSSDECSDLHIDAELLKLEQQQEQQAKNNKTSFGENNNEVKAVPPHLRQGVLVVQGACVTTMNGPFFFKEEFDGVGLYSRKGFWGLERAEFSLFRCRHSDSSRRWYISIISPNHPPGTVHDTDIFTAVADGSPDEIPPETGWRVVVGSGMEGAAPMTMWVPLPEKGKTTTTLPRHEKLCCVCHQNVVTHVVVPCGHACLCSDCAEKSSSCGNKKQQLSCPVGICPQATSFMRLRDTVVVLNEDYATATTHQYYNNKAKNNAIILGNNGETKQQQQH